MQAHSICPLPRSARWEDALAEQHVHVWVCYHIDLEGFPKLLEEVLPRPEEIGSHSLERACKELQAVFEHQVLTPAQPQSSLHPLTDEGDVLMSE